MGKVVFFANSSAGLYGFRNELMRALGQRHHVVACTADDGWLDKLRTVADVRLIRIDRRGMNPVKDLRLFFAYLSFLRKERPDMAITYTIKPNLYAGLACRLLRVPCAANITGLGTAFETPGSLRALVTLLYRAALRRARCVYFENAENMALFQRMGMVRGRQACLLSGAGVNLAHYAPAPYPGQEDVTRFLFIGRVMREKGIGELCAALSALHASGWKVFLDIIGPCEEDCSALIDPLVAQGIACFHGETDEVRPFIARCHCFVLPSYHEGMANTLLEAASMARPLITTDIPGCREAVADGETGLLCRPRDADSLARAMERFLSIPCAGRAEMGRRGRARMEAVFDKNKVVSDTIRRLGSF